MPESLPRSIRLPKALMNALAAASREEGTSPHTLAALAIERELESRRAERGFLRMRARGNPDRLVAMLDRPGGEAPRRGDEIPAGYRRPRPRRRKAAA
jgi:hypothetical protein